MITGRDIQTGHNAEVINKDLVIATLTENADFSMEMFARKGRGYVVAETNGVGDGCADMLMAAMVDPRGYDSSILGKQVDQGWKTEQATMTLQVLCGTSFKITCFKCWL